MLFPGWNAKKCGFPNCIVRQMVLHGTRLTNRWPAKCMYVRILFRLISHASSLTRLHTLSKTETCGGISGYSYIVHCTYVTASLRISLLNTGQVCSFVWKPRSSKKCTTRWLELRARYATQITTKKSQAIFVKMHNGRVENGAMNENMLGHINDGDDCCIPISCFSSSLRGSLTIIHIAADAADVVSKNSF